MSATAEQRRAIDAEGGDALVSASAGSGKTFVMINRIIRLILEGKAEVKDILAVTYVKLAAAEMKEKLAKALLAEIVKGGENAERLRRQLADIPAANISTLHSFCGDFLRTYFFEAGLDPRFSVADEGEAAALRGECLDRLTEELFEAEDADMLLLAEVYAKRRRLNSLKKYILELYAFLSSEADPFAFVRERLGMYAAENYPAMRAEMLAEEKGAAASVARKFAEFAADARAAGIEKYAQAGLRAAEALEEISRAESAETYFRALGAWSYASPALRFKDGDAAGTALRERQKKIAAAAKKLKERAEVFAEDPREGARKLEESGRVAAALVSVTEKFAAAYAARKAEEGKLDFSDLEHRTLELLENPEIRREAAGRFRYVFADEYQDINGAQESILRSLSDGNLFMVGDIKQSIYAFRGCNPEFFARKFASFRAGAGEAILLNGNFRSADAVLEAVNRVFSRVMTEGTAGLNYARDGVMTSGGLYGAYRGRASIRFAAEEERDKLRLEPAVYSVRGAPLAEQRTDAASRAVAAVVQEELTKTWYDIKEGREKRVTRSDIVVLVRSARSGEKVIRSLAEAGIPVSAERKGAITEYPEIKALVDLLRLICCAEQDAPLASVLLSPVGGFSEGELAAVRTAYPAGAFRDAVRSYAEREKDDLARRLSAFFVYFAAVRDRADFLPAGEVLGRVIAEKGIDLFYAAREGGESALRRMRRLIAESEAGGKKLNVREFSERVEKRGDSLTLSEAGGTDNVRVMSIHASKGLEFPVVILAGLSDRFNETDAKKEIIAHRGCGIAVKHYDLAARRQSETLLRAYAARAVRRSAVAEEMRLFYVAMTRAKYALHMICSAEAGNCADDRDVLSAVRFSDFLSEGDAPVLPLPSRADSEYRAARRVLVGEADSALTAEIRDALSFVYPHAAADGLPAKTTVTRLAESAEYYPVSALFGESSREKGTAIHALLEQFARTGRLADGKEYGAARIAALAEEWEKGGRLAPGTRALLDCERAAAALALPVFGELGGARLFPEQPFMAEMAARDLPEGEFRRESDEKILVQGVIDLLAIRGKEGVILDYKLTAIARAEDIAAKYRPQLELYRRAAEGILGIRVTRLSVVNLLTAEEIPLL